MAGKGECATYSVKEARGVLGVSSHTIRKLLVMADFPAHMVGGKWVIPAKKLERWAAANVSKCNSINR